MEGLSCAWWRIIGHSCLPNEDLEAIVHVRIMVEAQVAVLEWESLAQPTCLLPDCDVLLHKQASHQVKLDRDLESFLQAIMNCRR